MLLLELTILTSSSASRKLGINLDEDPIEVSTSINIDAITHISEHPDNHKLTNIYLTSGICLTSPYKLRDIISTIDPPKTKSDPLEKFNI